jgi:carboxyl-terminal processing protease
MLVSVCVFASCRKNDVDPISPIGEPGTTNKWVLDSMKRYYYWSGEITGNPDFAAPTDDFFKTLLNRLDRFSFISNNQVTTIRPSVFERFGFQYIIVNYPSTPNRVVGIVTLVAPGSPAASQKIVRGDYFSSVNDIELSSNNLGDIVKAFKSDNISLQFVQIQNGNWTGNSPKNLITGYFTEKPVYFTKSFRKSGVATGYMFYNAFNEMYDSELLTALAKLKSSGIKELILDLRYNPGGAVASSVKLAVSVLKQPHADQTYVIYRGNSHFGRLIYSFDKVLKTSANMAGASFADLVANGLGLERIFVLTSSVTASAAELIINNLRPYMQVIQIGGTTHGKDEGSVTIQDRRSPKLIPWIIKPIAFKLFNANDQGNYHNGLTPDLQVNEYARLPLPLLGDVEEPLIEKALEQIYGSTVGLDQEMLRNERDKFDRTKLPAENILINSMKTEFMSTNGVEVVL